jgi:aminomethyltransferase
MVQHKLSGPLAEEFLMTVTPSAIDALPKHSSTLSCLLNKEGGIVDDTVITRLGRDSFYFVTNAGCREQDLTFLDEQMTKFLLKKSAANPEDESEKPISWHILENHSLLALQGPLAQKILQPLIHIDSEDAEVDTDLSTLYFGHSRWLQLHIPASCTKEGTSLSTPSLLVSRTGYTGEDGFEISIPPESGSSAAIATSIAKALLEAKLEIDGTETTVCHMAGLAARDSLRLEAGMCLYGHDIGLDVTPPMAGLGWIVAKSRRNDKAPQYNGHEIINEQLASPKTMEKRRVGFIIENGPAAREGADIVALKDDGSEGEMVGKITSGLPAPSLDGKNIAMGYVKNGFHKKGTKVGVKVRGKLRKGEVEKMPFVESKFYRGT